MACVGQLSGTVISAVLTKILNIVLVLFYICGHTTLDVIMGIEGGEVGSPFSTLILRVKITNLGLGFFFVQVQFLLGE